MGLNTGLLDADALAETLIMVLAEGKPLELLDIYSDERRKVFQLFVDPVSTQNKLRVQNNDQEVATRDDWYFRLMANPSKEALMELATPYFETWKTDIRAIWQKRVGSLAIA
jgi:2-polyprenyl-6-methoxyphenol hydroxylase-like FAD-dependent oxidoreductase